MKRRLSDVLNSFKSLSSCPRELWLAYIIKFLESFAYFAMSINFTIYLSSHLGFSDTTAGVLYGIWGFLISIFGVITGSSLIDLFGARFALIVAGVVAGFGRLLFAYTFSDATLYIAVLCLMPFGISISIPALIIVIKRTTNDDNRSVAYGLFYSVMNVGALLAGPFSDILRESSLSELTSMRAVFIATAIASFLYAIVAYTMRPFVTARARRPHPHRRRRGGDVDEDMIELDDQDDDNVVDIDDGNIDDENNDEENDVSHWHRFKQNIVSAIKDPIFRKLALFMLFISLCRLIFRHLDATWPKAILRVDASAPYGTIYSINPAMIIVLVPLTQALLKRFPSYYCIVAGALVASASVFWMSLTFNVGTSILFVVTLSLGEAIYSPRVYEYSMALSPHAREGFYSTMSSVPMYFAKLIAGGISGALLERYCAADNCTRPELMWLFIGLSSFVPCLFLLLFRSYLYGDDVRRREREEAQKSTRARLAAVDSLSLVENDDKERD